MYIKGGSQSNEAILCVQRIVAFIAQPKTHRSKRDRSDSDKKSSMNKKVRTVMAGTSLYALNQDDPVTVWRSSGVMRGITPLKKGDSMDY